MDVSVSVSDAEGVSDAETKTKDTHVKGRSPLPLVNPEKHCNFGKD